ncbi:four helix bundle protein [Phaeocystidibacter marisrubri]|uniref:Four helix bundle protein n=1 Tax=Phaeocystidibacter marisrubri TaxID=1577780 RepID=A0A6L3ZL77_9FLAO|nr:four helix bundle protein [Phaeocystidibacter marisrubri]
METCRLSSLIESSRQKEQIIGSYASIPSNISEGAERESNTSFLIFLTYSSSSCAELHTQLTFISKIHPELSLPTPILHSFRHFNPQHA